MQQFVRAKTILSRYKEADAWFHIKYSMNLYRGCQHQCIYCDSRSACYHIANFEDILVKENAIELLRAELRRIKEKDTIGTGSMNDPYMPAERELELTRRALTVIKEFGFPLHIITKSDMVLRDYQLIKDIGRVYATVSITITTADDALSAIIEPGAPVSSLRFEAVRKLSEGGVRAGILLMPVLPFVTDTEQNITSIIDKARDAKAAYILPAFGMTLRDKQRDYFFVKLGKMDKNVLAKYQKYYHGQYSFQSPAAHKLSALFSALCKRYNIPTRIAPYQKPDNPQFTLFD